MLPFHPTPEQISEVIERLNQLARAQGIPEHADPPAPQPAQDSGLSTQDCSPRPSAKPNKPKPLSAARLQANRANARKSTGPKTPEGKAVSSQNALKHGLLATRVVPTNDPVEDPAAFEALQQELTATFQPADAFETLCVRRIAMANWRLDRAFRYECRMIEDYRTMDAAPLEAIVRTSQGFGPDPDPARRILPMTADLAKLVRYETLIDRELQRALTQLRQHRAGRQSRSAGLDLPSTEQTPPSPAHQPEAPARENELAPSANEGSSPSAPPPAPGHATDTTSNLKSEIRNLKSAPAPKPRTREGDQGGSPNKAVGRRNPEPSASLSHLPTFAPSHPTANTPPAPNEPIRSSPLVPSP